MRFLKLLLHNYFFFVCRRRICQPIVTCKKQGITKRAHAYQVAQEIHRFTFIRRQPSPFLVKRGCDSGYHQRYSDRYPPRRQCVFINHITADTCKKKKKERHPTKYINECGFHRVAYFIIDCKYSKNSSK